MIPIIPLGELCTFQNGGTPSRDVDAYFRGNIPWITGADITSSVVTNARSFITKEAIDNSATNLVPAGTVLLVTRTSVGKVAVAGMDLCFSQDVTALTPKRERLHTPYLVEFLRTQEQRFERHARGATIKGITRDVVAEVGIPLPPLPEQRRIAEVLDRAEALRAKRRAALAQLDILTQSIFLDLCGNPATNPKGWPRQALGDVAIKFSDGPFGSNLKTSHYTESGIRVVRLQNIGVREFLDDDKAFISTRHFEELSKHECLPGDVLIATLGDPNLRACIHPTWLKVALNKADCVQFRPDPQFVTAGYICALLNEPSTGQMAQDLIVGQTRLRISMGRLRGLQIPVPPLVVQQEFSKRLNTIEKMRATQCTAKNGSERLFASLQHRAFSEEL